tara:strand:+ start:1631 stop:2197 length:567 start_codon:yes stop_codon:yes gene_type:complete
MQPVTKRARTGDDPSQWTSLSQFVHARSLAARCSSQQDHIRAMEQALTAARADRDDKTKDLERMTNTVEQQRAVLVRSAAQLDTAREEISSMRAKMEKLTTALSAERAKKQQWRKLYKSMCQDAADALAAHTLKGYNMTPEQLSKYKALADAQAAASRKCAEAEQAAAAVASAVAAVQPPALMDGSVD